MLNPVKLSITADQLALISEVDQFNATWTHIKTLSPERLAHLKQVATIESIGSSTRIEGSKLSNAEIEDLFSKMEKTSFRDRDEQEVAGYRDAMNLIFESYQDLEITENHTKQLHQILLKHSTKDERHRGDYKKVNNHVTATNANGEIIGIIFATASPFETPGKMEKLFTWYNQMTRDQALHPLLITAVFIVVFLAIHPFQDGNGRLSRILTTLLLLRSGYTYVPYASFERVIEENKDFYYNTLRKTQETLENEVPDWEPWFGFFLRSLKRQKDNMQTLLKVEKDIAFRNLSSLGLQILDIVTAKPYANLQTITETTGANINTIKSQLKKMVSQGLLQRHGRARATWYTRS